MLTSAGDISVGQQQAYYMQFELRNTSFENRLKNNNNVTWFFQTWKYHKVFVQFPFQFNAGKWRVGWLRNGSIPRQTQKVRNFELTQQDVAKTFDHLDHPVWFIGLLDAKMTQFSLKTRSWRDGSIGSWFLISGHLWIDFTKLNGHNTVEDIHTWPLDVSSSRFSYSSSKWVSFQKIPNFPISNFQFPILLKKWIALKKTVSNPTIMKKAWTGPCNQW